MSPKRDTVFPQEYLQQKRSSATLVLNGRLSSVISSVQLHIDLLCKYCKYGPLRP